MIGVGFKKLSRTPIPQLSSGWKMMTCICMQNLIKIYRVDLRVTSFSLSNKGRTDRRIDGLIQ